MAEVIRTNAPEVAAHLHGLAGKLGDVAEPLERARDLLAAQETEVFASSGSALGVSWPSAAEPHRKVDPVLLVATGALRASLSDTSAGEVAFDRLRFGTTVPYAAYHQFGTSRMPARPILGISPTLAREFLDRLGLVLSEG
jgi:hypothetical protein